MKSIHLYLIVFTLFFFSVTEAQAVTMNVSTQSAMVGETVTVALTGVFSFGTTPPPYGALAIKFGDGSPEQVLTPLGVGSHTFTATHSYTSSGSYTITGGGEAGAFILAAPFIVTKKITIVEPVKFSSTLDRGEVGLKYKQLLKSVVGNGPYTYRLIKGKLPPGLTLYPGGLILGIPTQKGSFTSTVKATSRTNLSATQELTLYVDRGDLKIDVSPANINVTRAGTTSQKVTFTVVFPTVRVKETIRSNRGEFLVNGRAVGYYSRPMTINLDIDNPKASEKITIPTAVMRAAQNAGTMIINYRRTFLARNVMNTHAKTTLKMRTAAGGELRINKMRLYFEQNNRPVILVERNSRDLTGVLDIHYSGSGTLEGYWKADRRIIQRIQKHIFYGRVLTLKTPKIPPLPTYSEGAHRLQFIITTPVSAAEKIDFPQAIYHVEAKRAVFVAKISLTSPQENKEISYAGDTFSWTGIPQISTWLVEFIQQGETDPFFTAYTKKATYNLPAKIISRTFTADMVYRWRVRGFNAKGELAAKSGERRFQLAPGTAYVPGQLIFIVDNSDAGYRRISEITRKYSLHVLEQDELPALGRILVLCATKDQIPALSALLQQENDLYGSQPNFIFSTMAEKDPLRSMQRIDKLLDLDRIHSLASGKGVRVAIVDSGVDVNHRDLQKRVVIKKNFVPDSPYLAEIHGTAVAGIIAATHNDFGIIGIAPDAQLLVYRACRQLAQHDPLAVCYSSSIAQALDAAISDKADIVNLSFGTKSRDALISALIQAGIKKGILFVAPVGNDPTITDMAFPASEPGVTAVAGFDAESRPIPNPTLASQADAAAPARNIFTTTLADSHNFVDGTSYSAATISGLMTLSLGLHKEDVLGNIPSSDQTSIWQKQVAAYIGL